MAVISWLIPFVLAYYFLLCDVGDEDFFRRRFSEYPNVGLADPDWEQLKARAYFVAKVMGFRFQPVIAFITTIYVVVEAPQRPILIYSLPLLSALLIFYTIPLCDRMTLVDFLTPAFPRFYPYITGRQWLKIIHLAIVTASLAVLLFLGR